MSRQPSKTPLTWIRNSRNKWEKTYRVFMVAMISAVIVGSMIANPPTIALWAIIWVAVAIYRAHQRSPRIVMWHARRRCAFCSSVMQRISRIGPSYPIPSTCRHCGRMQPWAQPQPTPDHITVPTTNPKEQ